MLRVKCHIKSIFVLSTRIKFKRPWCYVTSRPWHRYSLLQEFKASSANNSMNRENQLNYKDTLYYTDT